MPTAQYEGEKDRHGEPHGFGTAIFEGGKYRGEWSCGHFHGYGELLLRTGMHYVGEFQEKKMHGRGRLRFSDGRLYEGEMRGGKMHGRGALQNPNGTYSGTFINGQRHGQGFMYYIDDSVYTGEWRDDKICGSGKLIESDGVVYEGKWEGGVKSGIVHKHKTSGSVYRQQYFDGRLASEERVKSGPSFFTRAVFGTEAEKLKQEMEKLRSVPPMPKVTPPNVKRGTSSGQSGAASPELLSPPSGFNRPVSAPVRRPGHVDPTSSPDARAPSDDLAAMSLSQEAMPSPEPQGATHDDDDDKPEMENGVPRLRKLKSLKDMSLKKPEEGGDGEGSASPLSRKQSLARRDSVRRPVSAQPTSNSPQMTSTEGSPIMRNASFVGAKIDSPRLSAKTANELEGAMQANSSFAGLVSPRSGTGSPMVHMDSGGQDSFVLSSEEMAQVANLKRHASTLNQAPSPANAMSPSPHNGSMAMSASGEEDVFSPLAKERRQRERTEQKLDGALQKSLSMSGTTSAILTAKKRLALDASATEASPNLSQMTSPTSHGETINLSASFGGINSSFSSPTAQNMQGSFAQGSTGSFAQLPTPVGGRRGSLAAPKEAVDLTLPPALQHQDSGSTDGAASPTGGGLQRRRTRTASMISNTTGDSPSLGPSSPPQGAGTPKVGLSPRAQPVAGTSPMQSSTSSTVGLTNTSLSAKPPLPPGPMPLPTNDSILVENTSFGMRIDTDSMEESGSVVLSPTNGGARSPSHGNGSGTTPRNGGPADSGPELTPRRRRKSVRFVGKVEEE